MRNVLRRATDGAAAPSPQKNKMLGLSSSRRTHLCAGGSASSTSSTSTSGRLAQSAVCGGMSQLVPAGALRASGGGGGGRGLQLRPISAALPAA